MNKIASERWPLRYLCPLLTICILFSVLLVACSSPALPTWLGGQSTEPTPSPPPEIVTLQVWSQATTALADAHLQTLLDDFAASHPTIVVNLRLFSDYSRRLRTGWSSDNAPDILYLPLFHLPDLVAAGTLAPLPPPLINQTDLYSHLRLALRVEDAPYCLPKSFYTLALFYNKTHFDEAGLAYPDQTWRWDDLRSAVEALTNTEQGRFGLALAADFSRWLAFLYQAGGTVTNPDGTAMAINSTAAQEALLYYTGLVTDGLAAPPLALDSRWPGEAFAKGRASMVIEGGWTIPYLGEAAPDLRYGIAALPAGPVRAASISFASCYAIVAQSTKQAAARELITYLTNAETLESWLDIDAAIPARLTGQQAWQRTYPQADVFINGSLTLIEWQLPVGFQPWVNEQNEGLRRIFGGFVPPDAFLPDAERSGNEIVTGGR